MNMQQPVATQQALTELLDARCLEWSDRLAIRFEDQTMTRYQTYTESNRLAHLLRELGAQPNHFIGLCLPQGPHTLVSMLGILKSGGAILALDPEYPVDRWNYITQ